MSTKTFFGADKIDYDVKPGSTNSVHYSVVSASLFSKIEIIT